MPKWEWGLWGAARSPKQQRPSPLCSPWLPPRRQWRPSAAASHLGQTPLGPALRRPSPPSHVRPQQRLQPEAGRASSQRAAGRGRGSSSRGNLRRKGRRASRAFSRLRIRGRAGLRSLGENKSHAAWRSAAVERRGGRAVRTNQAGLALFMRSRLLMCYELALQIQDKVRWRHLGGSTIVDSTADHAPQQPHSSAAGGGSPATPTAAALSTISLE